MSNSDPDSQIRERTRTVLPLDHLIRVTRNERSYTMYSGRDIGHRLLMQAGELKRKNAMKKTSYLCWDVEYVTTEDCEEETDGLAVDDAFDIDWSTERKPVHRRMKVESARSDMDDKIKDAIRSISLSGTARISVTNTDEPTKVSRLSLIYYLHILTVPDFQYYCDTYCPDWCIETPTHSLL